MGSQQESREWLRKSVIEDVLRTRGYPTDGWLRHLIEPVFSPPVNRFVNFAVEFDRQCELRGFMQAARWALPYFAKTLEVTGADTIPEDGPVLLLSNHPGAFDEVVIAATVDRPDLRILANSHPFLRAFPSICEHAIFSEESDAHARMNALRNGIKRLRSGQSVLVFPAGRTEPDPRCVEGASDALDQWSPSVELMVKKAPETRVVIALVSGVISPAMLNNPATWVRRRKIERQRIAQILQMSLQMLLPGRLGLNPRVTYSPPLSMSDLTGDGEMTIQQGLVAHARSLLELHTPQAPSVSPLRVETI
jgi:1-acyl-sn-glycerol-3-phosphate acyltransferase